MKRLFLILPLVAAMLLPGCQKKEEAETTSYVYEPLHTTQKVTLSYDDLETEPPKTASPVVTTTLPATTAPAETESKANGIQADGTFYYADPDLDYSVSLPSGWDIVTDMDVINSHMKLVSEVSKYDFYMDEASGDYILVYGISTGGVALPNNDFPQVCQSNVSSLQTQGLSINDQKNVRISDYNGFSYTGSRTAGEQTLNITGYMINLTNKDDPKILSITYYDEGDLSDIPQDLIKKFTLVPKQEN